MSEPIPESVPTSMDPRSRRPIKRRALTPTSTTASEISNLMADPSRPLELPPPSTATTKTLAPPPEIVANVQGSSAGAGSGEFHVYKAGRRREYERLRIMDEEVKKEKESKEWEDIQEKRKREDEERMRKNREKREKKKAKKGKGGAQTNGHMNGKAKSVQKSTDGGGRRDKHEASGKAGGTAELPKIAVEEVGVTIHDDD